MKKIFAALSIALLATPALAQSGTNSPYSQFGLGVLSDQGNSLNRGMNGVGLALRPHNQLNYLNPASYSAIDSLSFVFDAGLSLQMTNFKEGGVSKNANNANFEYVVGGFRVARNFGVAFGVLPVTNIGYNYSSVGKVSREYEDVTTAYSNTYYGTGGLHQVFLGVGFSPIKGLSIGVNGGYLWGELDRSITNSYTDKSIGSLTKSRYCSIANYKLDFGLQYEYMLNDKDRLAIGATYGLGHSLKADPTMLVVNSNSQTSIADTTKYVAYDGIDLPTQIAVGLSYSHGTKWTAGIDYSLQQWSKAKFPMEKNVNGQMMYVPTSDLYQDRHKINAGLEYCQNTEGRSFGSRIRYRVGASYATPHLKINGQDGPNEISVSAGVGIPIVNSINNRSVLNVSAQWVRSDAKNFITENTFRINVGFTFNERWFAKWKFD
ncbi:MAG: hypothetical protein Q4E26_06685 [Prevotellaceae bacterium]|nr:hypothetical protein [Prevotellaceae bacterium]